MIGTTNRQAVASANKQKRQWKQWGRRHHRHKQTQTDLWRLKATRSVLLNRIQSNNNNRTHKQENKTKKTGRRGRVIYSTRSKREEMLQLLPLHVDHSVATEMRERERGETTAKIKEMRVTPAHKNEQKQIKNKIKKDSLDVVC